MRAKTSRRRNPDAGQIRDMLYRGDSKGALQAWLENGGDEVAEQYLANSLDISINSLRAKSALYAQALLLDDDSEKIREVLDENATKYPLVNHSFALENAINSVNAHRHQDNPLYRISTLEKAIKTKNQWLLGNTTRSELVRANQGVLRAQYWLQKLIEEEEANTGEDASVNLYFYLSSTTWVSLATSHIAPGRAWIDANHIFPMGGIDAEQQAMMHSMWDWPIANDYRDHLMQFAQSGDPLWQPQRAKATKPKVRRP